MISQSPSAPLVAVVGATGNQGGSVVNALEESDKPYRIRAFTRDPSKKSAQELTNRGIEVVGISLTVENKEAVYKAFAGADIAFIVTNFWEHLSMDREVAEGKLLIDAAKAGGATRIVFSGLPSVTTLTAGKYTHVYHFDGKAAVAEYGRQSGVPFVDIQAGAYASNFTTPLMAPKKQPDGSYAIEFPLPPTVIVPVIDIVSDYGLFVRQALEAAAFPDGQTVYTTGEELSFGEIATQWSEATGKKIAFKQITAAQWEAHVQSLGLPPHVVVDAVETFVSMGEFGFYGWKSPSPEIFNTLARKPRTWMEFAKAADWSTVLA